MHISTTSCGAFVVSASQTRRDVLKPWGRSFKPRRFISAVIVISEMTPRFAPANRNPSRANLRASAITRWASIESGTLKSFVAPLRPFISSAGTVQTSPLIWSTWMLRSGPERDPVRMGNRKANSAMLPRLMIGKRRVPLANAEQGRWLQYGVACLVMLWPCRWLGRQPLSPMQRHGACKCLDDP